MNDYDQGEIEVDDVIFDKLADTLENVSENLMAIIQLAESPLDAKTEHELKRALELVNKADSLLEDTFRRISYQVDNNQ